MDVRTEILALLADRTLVRYDFARRLRVLLGGVPSPDARRGEIEVVVGDLDGRFSPLTAVDGDLVESATTALADHIAAILGARLVPYVVFSGGGEVAPAP